MRDEHADACSCAACAPPPARLVPPKGAYSLDRAMAPRLRLAFPPADEPAPALEAELARIDAALSASR